MVLHSTFVIFLAIIVPACVTEALIYQCDHYGKDGQYTSRHCTLHGVQIVHDGEDVDFTSEYPRPYYFDFQQSKMDEIPRALFTAFPEMQTIDFQETGIETINKFTFEKAKQLRDLYLTRNRLMVLNNLIFKGCDLLEWLDLSHNRIHEIKEKAFYDISTLIRLDLNNNRLETLPENVFADLPSLANLNLNENLLTTLGERIFDHNRLISLSLNDNRLQTIHLNDTFQSWQLVRLRGNFLKSVVLPSTPILIDLSHNNLTTIEILNKEYGVQTLDLSHNLFTDVGNISKLTNLYKLDLSFNVLQALPLTIFLKMKYLEMLNLEATNLTALEHGIFSQQSNLTLLDVSFNRFKTLDLTVLTAATKLDHLQIDGNNLSSIQYHRLPAMFPSLTYLGLFANAWNCSYLVDLVQFCREHSIKVYPLKAYATTLDVSNVQGIYCKSSQESILPAVAPVDHPMGTGSASKELTIDHLVNMMNEMNRTTEQLLQEMVRTIRQRPGDSGVVGGGPAIVTASCTELHAYNYQVFILLILSIILIINVGFLLWVQHNANVRRAVDRMIIFRREQGASIQTALHEEV